MMNIVNQIKRRKKNKEKQANEQKNNNDTATHHLHHNHYTIHATLDKNPDPDTPTNVNLLSFINLPLHAISLLSSLKWYRFRLG